MSFFQVYYRGKRTCVQIIISDDDAGDKITKAVLKLRSMKGCSSSALQSNPSHSLDDTSLW
jgi:hypothetical protein